MGVTVTQAGTGTGSSGHWQVLLVGVVGPPALAAATPSRITAARARDSKSHSSISSMPLVAAFKLK